MGMREAYPSFVPESMEKEIGGGIWLLHWIGFDVRAFRSQVWVSISKSMFFIVFMMLYFFVAIDLEKPRIESMHPTWFGAKEQSNPEFPTMENFSKTTFWMV